jgi:hypothetical protein
VILLRRFVKCAIISQGRRKSRSFQVQVCVKSFGPTDLLNTTFETPSMTGISPYCWQRRSTSTHRREGELRKNKGCCFARRRDRGNVPSPSPYCCQRWCTTNNLAALFMDDKRRPVGEENAHEVCSGKLKGTRIPTETCSSETSS